MLYFIFWIMGVCYHMRLWNLLYPNKEEAIRPIITFCNGWISISFKTKVKYIALLSSRLSKSINITYYNLPSSNIQYTYMSLSPILGHLRYNIHHTIWFSTHQRFQENIKFSSPCPSKLKYHKKHIPRVSQWGIVLLYLIPLIIR